MVIFVIILNFYGVKLGFWDFLAKVQLYVILWKFHLLDFLLEKDFKTLSPGASLTLCTQF